MHSISGSNQQRSRSQFLIATTMLVSCVLCYGAAGAVQGEGSSTTFGRVNPSPLSASGFAPLATTWFLDADGDGYGNPLVTVVSDTQPLGYVADGSDCDDTRALVHPGAAELCDNLDNDCNGSVDDTACARYVAVTGDDTVSGLNAANVNACSVAATPCRTIVRAVTAATPGDTVHVAEGAYSESVLIKKPLSLLGPKAGVHGNDPSRGTHEATITSPDGMQTVIILDAVVAVVDGFDLVGPNQLNHSGAIALADGLAGRPYQSVPEGGLTDITIRNCVIRSMQDSYLYLGEGIILRLYGDTLANRFTIENNHFKIGGGPGNDANGHFAMFLNDQWDRPWPLDSPDRIILRGNRIEDHGQLYIDGVFGLLIEGNDFSGSRWRPIEMKHVERATVRNNDLSGAWGVGILAESQAIFGSSSVTHNIEIAGNTIRNIQYAGEPGFQDQSGIIIGGATNVSIHNNFIENNARYGIVVAGNGFDYFTLDYGPDAAVGAQPSGISIHDNSISGNGVGLHVDSVINPAIDATANWWGLARGPAAVANTGSVALGRGDAVDAGATFSPWLGSGVDMDIAAGFQPDAQSLYGIASRLIFATQPGGAVAGAPIAPQPVVHAVDASGNLGINFDGSISLTPLTGALAGSNVIAAVDGAAAFSGVAIQNPESSETLTASASSVTSGTSAPFDIIAVPVAQAGPGALTVTRSVANASHLDLSFGDVGAQHYNVYVSNAPWTNPFAVASPGAGRLNCAVAATTNAGSVFVGDFDPAAGISGDTSILYILVTGDSGPRTEGSLGPDSAGTARTADAYCNR